MMDWKIVGEESLLWPLPVVVSLSCISHGGCERSSSKHHLVSYSGIYIIHDDCHGGVDAGSPAIRITTRYKDN
jgi:hypothetical protein